MERARRGYQADIAPLVFVGPGFHPLTVAAVFAAGRSGEELRDDHMLSFYLRTPSGFEIEHGWGGSEGDDAS